MLRHKKTAITIIGVTTVLTSSLLTTAAYADSDRSAEPSPAATDIPSAQPDRIIYIDGPAPRPSADARITSQESTANTDVTVTEGTDFPVVPELGESVRIIYTDSVMELSTFTDSTTRGTCTVSLSTDSPMKISNRAYVAARGSVSSGCGSARTIKLGLYEGSVMRANSSWGVPNNGSTFGSSALASPCDYGFDTPFYGIAAWSFGGSAYGPTATIACRYF